MSIDILTFKYFFFSNIFSFFNNLFFTAASFKYTLIEDFNAYYSGEKKVDCTGDLILRTSDLFNSVIINDDSTIFTFSSDYSMEGC